MREFNFDPAALRESFDRLYSKGKTVANEQVVSVRHILSGLYLGKLNETTVTAIAIAAMGNPKTPKGKAIEKLGGLNDRNVPGGDAMRKVIKASLAVMDYRYTQGENGDAVEVTGFADIVGAFIDNEKGAPKGIYALEAVVKALWQDACPEAAPSEGDASEGDASEGEGEPQGEPASLADIAFALAAQIAETPVSELSDASAALAALHDAINAASDRIAESEARKVA